MSTGTSDSGIAPAVSVVLPTYNRASLLGRSIRNVLGQSYSDFEVLVVDDGSKDETEGIVSGFRDRRVRYIPLASNTGAGAAHNVGIRMARGRFLAFQDSDDEWLPSKLAKQMSAFERGPARLGMVYSDMQMILTDGTETYFAAPTVLPGRLINPANPVLSGSQSRHSVGRHQAGIPGRCRPFQRGAAGFRRPGDVYSAFQAV